MMAEKWVVIINGQTFVEKTVRTSRAIHLALQRYRGKHCSPYEMVKDVTIYVRRENLKDFPTSKIV